ncbi:MAG: hypothetical protein R8N50_00380 [Alphaproteobacteria bacterium]|nr:hypothetical protein [Alphaproteobacteria bacterium]
MANKKLFPGITEQDIKKQEQAKRMAEEKANKEREVFLEAENRLNAKKEQERQEQEFNRVVEEFYQKFGDKVQNLKMGLKQFVYTQLIFLGMMHGIWLFGHAESEKDAYGFDKGINFFELALSESDSEAAEKTEKNTGSKALGTARYFMNPTLETYNFANLFRKESYIALSNGDLRSIRAYVGLVMIITTAASLIYGASEDKKNKINDIKKLLILWQQNNLVDIKMQEFVNKDMIGKIISHMSGQNAKYFQQIINGEKSVSFEIAVKIMEGHLKAHPEDLQMVLDVFDERSIPSGIKNMAAAKER